MSFSEHFSQINSPVFANVEKTSIDCMVTSIKFGIVMPFTASSTDPEQYGKDLFKFLMEGGAGEVAPYVPPSPDVFSGAVEIKTPVV